MCINVLTPFSTSPKYSWNSGLIAFLLFDLLPTAAILHMQAWTWDHITYWILHLWLSQTLPSLGPLGHENLSPNFLGMLLVTLFTETDAPALSRRRGMSLLTQPTGGWKGHRAGTNPTADKVLAARQVSQPGVEAAPLQPSQGLEPCPHTPWFWPSEIQDCRHIHFSCLKPPSLREQVTTAPGNEYRCCLDPPPLCPGSCKANQGGGVSRMSGDGLHCCWRKEHPQFSAGPKVKTHKADAERVRRSRGKALTEKASREETRAEEPLMGRWPGAASPGSGPRPRMMWQAKEQLSRRGRQTWVKRQNYGAPEKAGKDSSNAVVTGRDDLWPACGRKTSLSGVNSPSALRGRSSGGTESLDIPQIRRKRSHSNCLVPEMVTQVHPSVLSVERSPVTGLPSFTS